MVNTELYAEAQSLSTRGGHWQGGCGRLGQGVLLSRCYREILFNYHLLAQNL